MLILEDQEAQEVIRRLEILEEERPEFQDRDRFGRTLAERLALSFSHSKGKSF